MKTLKLVLGILCMVLFAFIMFQSCAAGLGNALAENGESSGSAGVLVAFGMLVGGIVMVATRKNESKGGSIACIIIFLLVGIFGFAGAGSYADLKIWSVLCLILAGINLISVIKTGKGKKEEAPQENVKD